MELSDLHKNDLKIKLVVSDFSKVHICRITFGRPRSTTQNYLRARGHKTSCSSSHIEGWWSMELPCDDLASNGGLKFEIRWVLMSVWSFSFFVWKSCGSSQIKLNQFLLQWICNEPLIITGVSDLHENGLRIQFTTQMWQHAFSCESIFFAARVGSSNDVRSSWN